MTNIILAFSKLEDGRILKSILARNGFEAAAVCTLGAQTIRAAQSLNSGIVVSGYRFEDMFFNQLRQYLPTAFDMLLISSPGHFSGLSVNQVVCLPMPLKVQDLISTLEMMVQSQLRVRKKQRGKPRQRSAVELGLIRQAKELLMERSHMSESQAHRYLQKCSMDSGTSLVETAEMVITLIHV